MKKSINSTAKILGIPITLLDERKIILTLHNFIKNGEKRKTIFCANPHSIVESLKDPEFFQALNSADIVLPDGIGVVFAAKILNEPIGKRISGPDFFVNFSKFLNMKGEYSYFFLGSTEVTLRRIEVKMKELFPNIKVVGIYSPPFGEWNEEEDEKIISIINEKKPDVLWVGLTAPKQEKWIHKNKHKLDVSLLAAIGAAFDFFAGTKRRAPQWMRDIGLEWLWRFSMEPKRLWRRNLISAPSFLYFIFREKLRLII